MAKEKKVKLIKKIWLAFFIVMILNNVIGESVLVLAQSGPNPFATYLPQLIPLGYLLAGVLFVLGLIAYRKDYSYAILLISAAALVAGLLNYSVSHAAGVNGGVLKVVPVNVCIRVIYNNQTIVTTGHANSFEAPTCQNFEVCYSTSPPIPATCVKWYIGNILYDGLPSGEASYTGTFQTSADFAGTNTIIVEVDKVINGTLYYGYGYVEFRYIPCAGTLYQDVMDALMVVSGIGALAGGYAYQELSMSITDAINNLITTPTIGGSGASGDAGNLFNYFQNIAISLGFVLIALGIGINAIKGGYSDMVDLGMDFFYRSGVFLLFTYGGEQIFNAVANSLNMISQYIVSSVLGQIANTLAVWTGLATALMVGANFIGFGFGRSLTDFAVFIFEIDIAIFSISYIRVVLILALASLIPLIAAMWTFEWTRGIALALTEILAGLVFGGLVDALLLYFMVQVGGLAFFMLAPAAILAMLMTGWGAHQVAKSVGLSVASKATPSPVVMPSSSRSGSSTQTGTQQTQNVPITQVIQPQSVQGTKVPQGQMLPPTQTVQQEVISPQVRIPQTQQATQQQAIQQLGTVSTIRLNNGNRYATVKAVQGGYLITKGIRTDQGAVEKNYTIPAYKPIEEVAAGVRKNFIEKGETETNPELIGAFFKSLESEAMNGENVKVTGLR